MEYYQLKTGLFIRFKPEDKEWIDKGIKYKVKEAWISTTLNGPQIHGVNLEFNRADILVSWEDEHVVEFKEEEY